MWWRRNQAYGEEVVSVNIPAGVAEGMQLSMGGKGNAGKHRRCGRRLIDPR